MLTLDEPAAWRDAAVQSLRLFDSVRLTVRGTSRRTPASADLITTARSCRGQYFSVVDPDNIYCFPAFTALADLLDRVPAAVAAYCDERLIDADGRDLGIRHLPYSSRAHRQRGSLVHSCVVFRRSAVEPYLGALRHFPNFPEWALSRMVARDGPILHVPIVGRSWRIHPGQAHRRAAPAEIARIRNL